MNLKCTGCILLVFQYQYTSTLKKHIKLRIRTMINFEKAKDGDWLYCGKHPGQETSPAADEDKVVPVLIKNNFSLVHLYVSSCSFLFNDIDMLGVGTKYRLPLVSSQSICDHWAGASFKPIVHSNTRGQTMIMEQSEHLLQETDCH